MKNRCVLSGVSLGLTFPTGFKRPETYRGERGRMVICPKCNRELKVSRAGFGGASGMIPQHNDPTGKA